MLQTIFSLSRRPPHLIDDKHAQNAQKLLTSKHWSIFRVSVQSGFMLMAMEMRKEVNFIMAGVKWRVQHAIFDCKFVCESSF